MIRIAAGALICLTAASLSLAPSPAKAKVVCGEWLDREGTLTGLYQPAEETYARHYVFALLLDCGRRRQVVTVQRPTGKLPVCDAGKPVEVTGTLKWNGALPQGHYEINRPTSVACR